MGRKQFTFYESFWAAFKALPKKDRLSFITAVGTYVFEEELLPLTGPAAATFELVRPILDKADKLAKNGAIGGSKPKANRKQNASKGEANRKQTGSEKEGEIEIEVEDDSPPYPPEGGFGFGEALSSVLADWVRYKAERGQAYGQTGLQALTGQVRQKAEVHGEAAVAAAIRESMASGWAGIVWQRAEQSGRGTADREDLSWMKPYVD